MAENWVQKFTTPYRHHVDISLRDFNLTIRYKLLRKMLIYIELERKPQKYTMSKLLRSKVKKICGFESKR